MVERGCECIRERISKRPNFSLKKAFEYCDKSGMNQISNADFKITMSEHGFYATDRELKTLMERFDKDKDGVVNFSEFCEEILPQLST